MVLPLTHFEANGMSEAITMALYFLICREMGESAIFPGNKAFYNTVDDQSYAPGIADMSVWASINDRCKNEAFNHVNGDVIMWRYFWPAIGAYFGLDVSTYLSLYATFPSTVPTRKTSRTFLTSCISDSRAKFYCIRRITNPHGK